MIYTIYEGAISVNKMKAGKTVLTKEYRDFLERASLELAYQKPVMRKGDNISVKITFYYKELYRQDIDNGVKAVLDSATRAGLWTDDRKITTLVVKKEKSDKPRVEIEILN